MISQATAGKIWNAYAQIASSEELLKATESLRPGGILPTDNVELFDRTGNQRTFQLGVPCGVAAHKMINVAPVLAESMIRAHIFAKKAELAALNEIALAEASS